MYKFINIINGSEYEDILRSEILYKYTPKKILYAFQNKIEPRILCSYISKDDEKVIGLAVGMTLNKENISEDEYKNKIIDTINNLKTQEDYKNIEYLVSGNLDLDIESLDEIKERCNINVSHSKKVFARNVLPCLNEICKMKKKELSQKEVFIISDDTKMTQDLVMDLALPTKFISVYSKDYKFGERLEKRIFMDTGLALNITRNINANLDSFNIIINLSEDVNLKLLNIALDKTIIDLSKTRSLMNNSSKGKRRATVVYDLFFENDNNIYSENGKCEFDKHLSTELQILLGNSNTKIKKIQINNKTSNINKGTKLPKLRKQEQSYFRKTE